MVSIFTLYQKAGVLLKNPKNNTLNAKMCVFFFVFGGMVGKMPLLSESDFQGSMSRQVSGDGNSAA